MKILCIGRNYAEHARELNNAVPEDPVLFMKAKNALLLPDKPLYYPEFTQNLHYECELVVKICKNGKHIGERFARKYYNEMTLGIDFTARDVQQKLKEKSLPWEMAKAFDGSAAVGRFLPIPEGLDMQQLSFELQLNGHTVQQGATSDMIFAIDRIISFASKYFTLNIGDLLFTGTPAGVGPVQVNDRLQGFLEGQPLLDVSIM
jgi:2-keto-4-pentenoate hydratase/2-oxohepta-3-ene-1,7-dioic acid hydratase in catechol pathway